MGIKYFKKYGGHGKEPDTAHFTALSDTPADYDELPRADVTLILGSRTEVAPGQDPSELLTNRYKDQGTQQVLFEQTPSIIDSAFSDHRLRGRPAMNLLGMAVAEGKQRGYGLTYSSSLSGNSSPIAKMGLDFGVVLPNPDNPEAKVTNNIAASGAHNYVQTSPQFHREKYSPAGTEVDPEELKAGKSEVVNIINRSREARALGKQFDNSGPVPEQLQLSEELAVLKARRGRVIEGRDQATNAGSTLRELARDRRLSLFEANTRGPDQIQPTATGVGDHDPTVQFMRRLLQVRPEDIPEETRTQIRALTERTRSGLPRDVR